MNDQRIEASLRAGPLDLPSTSRPLVLPPMPLDRLEPHGVGVAAGSRRSRRRLTTALAAVAFVAVVGVGVAAGTLIAVGAGTGSRSAVPTGSVLVSQSPSGALSALELGAPRAIGGGITLRVPVGWTLVTTAGGTTGEVSAAIANFDLAQRCHAQPVKACADAIRLGSGDVVLTVSNDETPMRIPDLAGPSDAAGRVDGMPAALQVVEAPPGTQITGVLVPAGCDAHRAWWIQRPGKPLGWLDLEACSSRADRGVFRAVVDGIAQSVDFP